MPIPPQPSPLLNRFSVSAKLLIICLLIKTSAVLADVTVSQRFDGFNLALDSRLPGSIEDAKPMVLYPELGRSDSIVRSSLQQLFCQFLAEKLITINFRQCILFHLHKTEGVSELGLPLFAGNFNEREKGTTCRILVLGGVHGDELTSVSSVFHLLTYLQQESVEDCSWRFMPLVNPDGFFLPKPTRTNHNGVDLNRNLPTSDWQEKAVAYWKKYAKSSPRRFPGPSSSSETESVWVVNEITEFEPNLIISFHAPYGLVDYDGIANRSHEKGLGKLPAKLLGTFPGSLGRYMGDEQSVPVITIEMPHASVLPNTKEMAKMWNDLRAWINEHVVLSFKPH